ncbi:hypothetical protein [Aminobacter aminovorans]|uniref:Polyhydroxyalkanoate synthesis regulator phasin n=1 Tax=Aminobacter aminovorans TaxID=83263 RepID=A0AAC8YMT4_AMIAI|nr:hypothetical protein [Aminobacter aminovorans]AMS41202.1 hypothetical protein AA2016_2274 [Aminobacter aminovorans]MBB3705815.1 polyhydroxyalkanoate synthesis regulator phasin [Aminobacter aminovorans]
MDAPSIIPSLDDLRSCLERAERDAVCAEMIDDFARRQVELPKATRRVAELRAQISRLEETF